MGIENRIVIITGATGRLRRVVAKNFAEQDARLVLVSTNNEKLQQLVEELNLAEDRILEPIADLSQPGAAKQIAHKVLAKEESSVINGARIPLYAAS